MDVAVLVNIIKETDKNWRFVFESPLYDKLDFISGCLVQLAIEDKVDKGYYHKRNYSIASWADGTNRFELIITYLEGGKFSEWLFKEAKIGDEVYYRGPMGVFTLPEDLTQRDIYLVSTGSGVSPFRSMINYIYENKVPFKNIKLFFGTRTESDLLYREEFEKIQKELPNFEYIPVLSQEDKEGFRKGHVHKHYLNAIANGGYTNTSPAEYWHYKPLVYFCGWDRMINEGRKELTDLGYEMTKDIRVEIFG